MHRVDIILSHTEPVVFTNSLFGAGKYPIIYSNTACGGYEASLTDCNKQTYPQSNCSRDNVAGLLCGYGNVTIIVWIISLLSTDCQNGDVRLSGGTTANEGNVEICFNRLWGTVSESGWSDTEAGILCQQLGYVKEGTHIIINIITITPLYIQAVKLIQSSINHPSLFILVTLLVPERNHQSLTVHTPHTH